MFGLELFFPGKNIFELKNKNFKKFIINAMSFYTENI